MSNIGSQLGARYIALGDNQRAVEHLETALRLDPSSAFAHLNASLALYFLKRSDQGRAIRAQCDPADAWAP
ncbi:MAG: hypothetical protein DMG58_05700 [Acidobacteria bacterium]|nr:MAG: hypothetical protein DMG58_05700 [Acidobacteriota bacterium]